MLAGVLAPGEAGAEPIYRYSIEIGQTNYSSAVFNINPALTSTVRVVRGGVQLTRNDNGSGSTNSYLYYPSGILPGDVVQVYQPITANPIPNTTPVETFTVPAFSATFTPGSQTVTGTAEADAYVHAAHSPQCGGLSDSAPAANSGGAFSATFPVPLQNGENVVATAVQPDGDVLTIRSTVPGDAGCLGVDATSTRYGGTPSQYPYEVWENGMDMSAIPTSRMVLRRSGVIVAQNDDAYIALTPDLKPQPGDVIEVYRPKTATDPVRTFTLPSVSAVFDPGNEMVAVSSPAASLVYATACRAFYCYGASSRSARGVPAGRTLFTFAQPLGDERAIDIHPDDQVFAEWDSPDEHMTYEFDATPGDLTSPIGAITLAKKLKLGKIGKKIKFKLNSNEAGSALSTLTTTPPGRAKKGRASAKKPFTLAAATTTLKVGTNTVSMKVSKKGKKTIKKIIASGKSQKGTLQVTLTDAAGNATTVVKTTKLTLK